MEYKKLNGYYVVRMDPKEEIMETLMGICEKENITCAKFAHMGTDQDHEVKGVIAPYGR